MTKKSITVPGGWRTVLPAVLMGAVVLTGCSGNSVDAAKKPPAKAATGSGASSPGSSKLSAKQFVVRATKTTAEASSISFRLNSVENRKVTKASFKVNATGDCTGTVEEDGASIDFIKAGEQLFVKVSDEFWAAQGDDGAARDAVGDRWIEVEKDDEADFQDLADACDLKSLLGAVTDDALKAVQGEPVTIDGQQAIPVQEKDGKETTTAYISTDDDPKIIKIEESGGAETSDISFFDFDKPVVVAPPAPSETVKLSEFTK
jgi:hypothetical protein